MQALRCTSFFFNNTAATEIYTLSLHDALPILRMRDRSETLRARCFSAWRAAFSADKAARQAEKRSEEHTSELQSHSDLVCRLLLEKKKKPKNMVPNLDECCGETDHLVDTNPEE